MMNQEQYLLVKIAEEAAEIAQIALKSAQFGLDETYQDIDNKGRLYKELDDLMCCVLALNNTIGTNFSYQINHENIRQKSIKLNEYSHYSAKLGCIENSVIYRPYESKNWSIVYAV